jgi:hypothetical protein
VRVSLAGEVGLLHLTGGSQRGNRERMGRRPDALASMVVAHDVLVHSAGHQVHIVSPLDVARRAREGLFPPPPEWMTRRIGR